MNQKKKNFNSLLVTLENCQSALENKNFNLAEVWTGEYFAAIPQELVDQQNTKAFYDALQQRNAELLLAAVEAEIERLRTEKVKRLREAITQS